MYPRRTKIICFTLEGINSFAATFYLYYLFWLMQREHGFTNRGNLFLTAVHGCVYMFASWLGGRLIHRLGYFKALRLGFGGMAFALLIAWGTPGVGGQIIGLVLWTVPLCLTWPTLEALVTEGEDFRGTAGMVGLYNVVWSVMSALAFCSGGWLFEKLGHNGFYLLPLALVVTQFTLTFGLQSELHRLAETKPPAPPEPPHKPTVDAVRPAVSPLRFRQMAWLANPFAYVAINTLGAVIPQLAARFELTPAQSGVFCSLWFYVRLGAFVLLWRWAGWHYRFRWLLAAFVGLIFSFAALLLAPQFWVVIAAQVIFGLAVGLIYYSSLFYSMDASDTKGEHGGLHEAAIGLGICAGPALGATALTFFPQSPDSGARAVTALLVCGLGGLVWLRGRK